MTCGDCLVSEAILCLHTWMIQEINSVSNTITCAGLKFMYDLKIELKTRRPLTVVNAKANKTRVCCLMLVRIIC